MDDVRISIAAGTASRGGILIPVPPRQFEILVLLASSRGALDARTAAEFLYAETSSDVGLDSLKVHIHRLRQRLGRQVIEFGNSSYRLGPNVAVDEIESAKLIRALTSRIRRLTADERTLLEETSISLQCRCSSRLYDHRWFVAFWEQLRSTSRDALAILGWTALEYENPEDALRLANLSLADEIGDERALEIALHAYAALGRPGSAIVYFREYSNRLRLELDIEPSIELAMAFRQGSARKSLRVSHYPHLRASS